VAFPVKGGKGGGKGAPVAPVVSYVREGSGFKGRGGNVLGTVPVIETVEGKERTESRLFPLIGKGDGPLRRSFSFFSGGRGETGGFCD